MSVFGGADLPRISTQAINTRLKALAVKPTVSSLSRQLSRPFLSSKQANKGLRSIERRPSSVLCVSLSSELQHASLALPQFSHVLAVNPIQLSGAAPIGSLAALLLLFTGFGAWRFTTYGRLQYITAAMLGRWVPKGGARVIQVGGGSRDLYYYPKDTVLVTAISPKLKKGLMGQAAIQAGVPVDVRQETPTHLSFQGNNSVEAVVCLQSMHTLPDLPRFLAEALRVLKPGSPFIFLQTVKGEGLSSLSQLLLGGSGSALDESALNRLKGMSGFESVEWDMALAGQNPHAIGVAIKAGGDSDEREVDFAQRINKSNRSKKKSVKAGFGKS